VFFVTLLIAGLPLGEPYKDMQAVVKKFFYDNGTQPVPFGNE
jgi:hypothetical protein